MLSMCPLARVSHFGVTLFLTHSHSFFFLFFFGAWSNDQKHKMPVDAWPVVWLGPFPTQRATRARFGNVRRPNLRPRLAQLGGGGIYAFGSFLFLEWGGWGGGKVPFRFLFFFVFTSPFLFARQCFIGNATPVVAFGRTSPWSGRCTMSAMARGPNIALVPRVAVFGLKTGHLDV